MKYISWGGQQVTPLSVLKEIKKLWQNYRFYQQYVMERCRINWKEYVEMCQKSELQYDQKNGYNMLA